MKQPLGWLARAPLLACLLLWPSAGNTSFPQLLCKQLTRQALAATHLAAPWPLVTQAALLPVLGHASRPLRHTAGTCAVTIVNQTGLGAWPELVAALAEGLDAAGDANRLEGALDLVYKASVLLPSPMRCSEELTRQDWQWADGWFVVCQWAGGNAGHGLHSEMQSELPSSIASSIVADCGGSAAADGCQPAGGAGRGQAAARSRCAGAPACSSSLCCYSVMQCCVGSHFSCMGCHFSCVGYYFSCADRPPSRSKVRVPCRKAM